MGIKEEFDYISKKYDEQRHQLIPCFNDYYYLPLKVMDTKTDSPKILDIGSGTGLFSSIILEKYPNGEFTLIDLSEQMLNVAKERFHKLSNFSYIVSDYTTYEFENKFDIIISALSIHHLSPKEKENLYHKCYSMLNNDGIFINVDQVLSPSPAIELMFSNIWRSTIESSGLSHSEIQKAYERVKFDNPSPLTDQLQWLNDAGFKMADCLYKYFHFCVLYAKK